MAASKPKKQKNKAKSVPKNQVNTVMGTTIPRKKKPVRRK